MKKTLSITSGFVCLALASLFPGYDQDKTRYVAIVDDEKISVENFKEGYKKYLDNDEIYRRRLEEIHLQALMDRYARSISVDTISVSEQELWREFRAFNSKASARYLYARTEEEAWKLKKQLDRGATFESLARDIFEDPGLANNGGYLGYFGWGEMESGLEDAAFTLPVGQVSDPIRLRIGYAIVKVEDRIQNSLAAEDGYAKAKEKLTHEIFHKKTEHVLTEVLDNITKSLSPQFNDQAVQHIYQNWQHILNTTLPGFRAKQRAEVLDNIGSLDLVKFQKSKWTVIDFVKKVEKTTERQRKRVKSEKDIKDMCLGLAAREILLDRARKAGFEKDPMVRDQIARVREEYLLKRWAQSVQDTDGQSEWDESLLQEHFKRNSMQYQFPPEVDVAEILVRTELEAQNLFNRIKKGENFAELARKNSIRLWAAKQDGELGFGTEVKFGILGKTFFAAKVGQLIGPERIDPYYGIFKILAKREGRPKKFEEAREQIIEELSFVKK